MIKEILFQIKKRGIAEFTLWQKRLSRLFYKNKMTLESSYQIPIIINNRNRFTYLLQLITWLEKNKYNNIYIIDNDSTFQPLLDYYKTTKHKVFYLNKNVGFMSLWETDIFQQFKSNYYVYTDPDVLPTNDCPEDVIFQLYNVLSQNYFIEKCGVALKINDLPDYYKNKEAVIADEKKHWQFKVSDIVYDAPVDTTFALYRPLAKGKAEDCKAYRLSGKYDFYHLPWYENSLNPTEENSYYINHVRKGATMWSEKN